MTDTVHIVPTGKRFTIRVGPYQRPIDYRTAEAANLSIPTRDADGNGLPCFDNLTRHEAERIAVDLAMFYDAYNRTSRSETKLTEKRRSEQKLHEKYTAAMNQT